jgi:hypothetical protein
MIPKVNSCLILDVELNRQVFKLATQALFLRSFRFGGKIGGVKIDKINILDAKLGRSPQAQIPNRLRHRTGNQLDIWKRELVEAAENFPKGAVLLKRRFETLDQA